MGFIYQQGISLEYLFSSLKPIGNYSVSFHTVTVTHVKWCFTVGSPHVESVLHAWLSLLNPQREEETTDELTSLPGSRHSKPKVMDVNKWPM